jgi:hypothetical protein
VTINVDEGEDCDEGDNDNDDDECSANPSTILRRLTVDDGEDCDDGNTISETVAACKKAKQALVAPKAIRISRPGADTT